MNWVEFSTVLIILATAIAGPVTVHAEGGTWWLVVVAAIMSISVGLGTGFLSGKLAYALLMKGSKGVSSGFLTILYLLLPMVFFFGSITIVIASSAWLVGVLS